MKIDHYVLVMSFLQEQIDLLDEYRKSGEAADIDEGDVEDDIKHKPQSRTTILSAGHVSLGAVQKACSFDSLEERYKGDVAFNNFTQHLGPWMSQLLLASGIDLPNNTPIKFHPSDLVGHQLSLSY